jgi:hypothetical protein
MISLPKRKVPPVVRTKCLNLVIVGFAMIKKYIPLKLRKKVPKSWKAVLHKIHPRFKWHGSERIFCISIQKTGTTSVGDFFVKNGYPTARYIHSITSEWPQLWYDGDFEGIFQSAAFKRYQVFEDDPWWYPEFYRVLYHRFPNSKFIFFTRNVDDWFNSMMNHSEGRTLGNTKRHCKLYRREAEFFDRLENDPDFTPTSGKDRLMSLKEKEDHYKELYRLREVEVDDFFKDKDENRFIKLQLTDPEKWKKLADFCDLQAVPHSEFHSNRTADRMG